MHVNFFIIYLNLLETSLKWYSEYFILEWETKIVILNITVWIHLSSYEIENISL